MNEIQNRKKRWILAILLAMLLTIFYGGGVKEPGMGVPGFFGMLYPQYCFSGEPKGPMEGIPMERKLTFRWLRGL